MAPSSRGGGCCYQVILIWLATLTASPQSCRAKTTPLAFSSSSVALLPPLRAVRSTVLSPTQPMQWHRSLSKPGPYCQREHCERRSHLASAGRTSVAMTASSADGSGPIRQFLEGLRRADLQSLAKENNIAANKVSCLLFASAAATSCISHCATSPALTIRYSNYSYSKFPPHFSCTPGRHPHPYHRIDL